MRLAVNTLPGAHASLRSHEAEFLARVLGIAAKTAADLEITVLTEAEVPAALQSFKTVPVPPKRKLMPGVTPMDRALRSLGAEVVLSPLSIAPAQAAVPQVLFALDTALYESDAPQKHAAQRLKDAKRATHNARRIVVTSEYLKRRCLDLFEAPLNKVAVAQPGADPAFAEPQRALVEAPYIVLIQSPLSDAALPAVRQVLQPRQGHGPALVVLGPWEDDPAQWPDLMHFEHCSDAHRASLFQHAECCIYPGEHDGCAIRLIEAMRAGALVASANTAACKEFGGDVPMHFNPQNGRSLLHALERLGALTEEKREERSRLAQSAAQRHSWDKCVWKLLDALQRTG